MHDDCEQLQEELLVNLCKLLEAGGYRKLLRDGTRSANKFIRENRDEIIKKAKKQGKSSTPTLTSLGNY